MAIMIGKDQGLFPRELVPIVHVADANELFAVALDYGAQADIDSGKFKPFRRLLGRVFERVGCVALEALYRQEFLITGPNVSDEMHSQYQRLRLPYEDEWNRPAFPDAFVLGGIGSGVCRLLSMVECKIPPPRSLLFGPRELGEHYWRLSRQLDGFEVLRDKLRAVPELRQVLLDRISTPDKKFSELDVPEGQDMSVLYVVPWNRRLDEMVDTPAFRVCQMVLTVTDDQIKEMVNARLGYQVVAIMP